MTMIDIFDDADCDNDHAFNDLLSELERTGEILRMFEQGEAPVNDDNPLTNDE